ncbi:hypothetical protein [Yoonia sp. BS5-3]|uniref:DUF5683 domain-containing protein n=1 Tax=Yoonia phaeophyticola TaxID=3137369 RepID=A0ABZ2V1A4_9RHOB
MPDYHPLDTRNKADKQKTDGPNRPWRKVADPAPLPGVKSGPIRDSDAMERRAREKIGNDAEQAALRDAPLWANLFGPATLYYKIKAALIGQRARGYGSGKIVFQIIGAFALYFALFYLDSQFGFSQMLGVSTEMYSID